MLLTFILISLTFHYCRYRTDFPTHWRWRFFTFITKGWTNKIALFYVTCLFSLYKHVSSTTAIRERIMMLLLLQISPNIYGICLLSSHIDYQWIFHLHNNYFGVGSSKRYSGWWNKSRFVVDAKNINILIPTLNSNWIIIISIVWKGRRRKTLEESFRKKNYLCCELFPFHISTHKHIYLVSQSVIYTHTLYMDFCGK